MTTMDGKKKKKKRFVNPILDTDVPYVPHSFPIFVDLSLSLKNNPGIEELMKASKMGNIGEATKAIQSIIASASFIRPVDIQRNGSSHDYKDGVLTPEKLLELLKAGYRTTSSEFILMVQILYTPDRNKRTAIYYASQAGHHGMVWIYLSLLVLSGLLVATRSAKEKIFATMSDDKVVRYSIHEWLDHVKYFQGIRKKKKDDIVENVYKAWGISDCSPTVTTNTIATYLSNKVTIHSLIHSVIHPNNPFSVFLSRMSNISGRKTILAHSGPDMIKFSNIATSENLKCIRGTPKRSSNNETHEDDDEGILSFVLSANDDGDSIISDIAPSLESDGNGEDDEDKDDWEHVWVEVGKWNFESLEQIEAYPSCNSSSPSPATAALRVLTSFLRGRASSSSSPSPSPSP